MDTIRKLMEGNMELAPRESQTEKAQLAETISECKVAVFCDFPKTADPASTVCVQIEANGPVDEHLDLAFKTEFRVKKEKDKLIINCNYCDKVDLKNPVVEGFLTPALETGICLEKEHGEFVINRYDHIQVDPNKSFDECFLAPALATEISVKNEKGELITDRYYHVPDPKKPVDERFSTTAIGTQVCVKKAKKEWVLDHYDRVQIDSKETIESYLALATEVRIKKERDKLKVNCYYRVPSFQIGQENERFLATTLVCDICVKKEKENWVIDHFHRPDVPENGTVTATITASSKVHAKEDKPDKCYSCFLLLYSLYLLVLLFMSFVDISF